MLGLVFALFLSVPIDPTVLTVDLTTVPIDTEITQKEWTVEEMKSLATDTAKRHGLKVQKFLDVVSCESFWNRHARGDYVNGKPTSFGLVQIHNPRTDWGMTIAQADDPEIALETMALKWSVGEAFRWSCWKP